VYGLAVTLVPAGRDCPARLASPSVASPAATTIPVSETIPPALRMNTAFQDFEDCGAAGGAPELYKNAPTRERDSREAKFSAGLEWHVLFFELFAPFMALLSIVVAVRLYAMERHARQDPDEHPRQTPQRVPNADVLGRQAPERVRRPSMLP
jgi:hypothetical protein